MDANNRKTDAAKTLMQHIKNSFECEKMDNRELAHLLLIHVWHDLEIDTLESALVNEAMLRIYPDTLKEVDESMRKDIVEEP